MERRDTYYMAHEHLIDSLRNLYNKVPPADYARRFEINHKLHYAYRSFQNDSARTIADRGEVLARNAANPDMIATARYDNIFTYMSRGDFTNAVEILEKTNLSNVSDSLKIEFYVLATRLFSDLSNFTSSRFEDRYAMKSRAYADSILNLAKPGSYPAEFASFFVIGLRKSREEGIDTFNSLLARKDVDNSVKAMLYSMLGDLYLSNGERHNGLEMKAQSAIMDIKSAVRETTSKHFLAYELFEEGDVNRAAKYIHVALEDAENYNAPQRKAEIGRTLSIIEASRYTSVEQQRNKAWIYLILTSVLTAVVIALFIYIRIQNKTLRDSKAIISKQNEEISKQNDEISKQNVEISKQNEEISDANSKLRSLNTQLRESIKIKDEYLGYVFYLISEYIKKIENIYKLVNLKIKVNQPQDLRQRLPISAIKQEKEKMLKEFDHIFLTLFPTFVEQYNLLFDKDEPTETPDGILTPEMRIFALIRLGITDSADIAQFLNYSVNTINTYKTKAKKRSIVSNDDFENRIMQIRSVK